MIPNAQSIPRLAPERYARAAALCEWKVSITRRPRFELVIIPGANHACDTHPYYVRRVWDFFVRELLGTAPPARHRSPY